MCQKEQDVAIVIIRLFQWAHPMQYPYHSQSLTNGRWCLLCIYELALVISQQLLLYTQNKYKYIISTHSIIIIIRHDIIAPVVFWCSKIGEGAFKCSLYLSPNVLADSPIYSLSQSFLLHLNQYMILLCFCNAMKVNDENDDVALICWILYLFML